ncbi:YihA family ribosome biogenesis GTP-binding protein, partial [Enterococcus faecium]|nr:YihA family ribosome biogenesis GTP-binding protein [Enterococcus faecium]
IDEANRAVGSWFDAADAAASSPEEN